jgi:hypothetical protein
VTSLEGITEAYGCLLVTFLIDFSDLSIDVDGSREAAIDIDVCRTHCLYATLAMCIKQ